MDNTHKENLRQLIEMMSDRITDKYTKGVEEHGGHLWRKGQMFLVEEAYNEAADLVVYLGQLLQILKGIENDK